MTAMTALIIPPEGAVCAVELMADESQQYQQIKDAVGGWIESVPITARTSGDLKIDGYTITVWCNEEGRMHGLSDNPRAQALAGYPLTIQGTCLVTGGSGEAGETLGLDPAIAQQFHWEYTAHWADVPLPDDWDGTVEHALKIQAALR